MLSRRNIRVKVMQGLYALNRDKGLGFADALKSYKESIDRSYDLYLFQVYFLVSVAKYARVDGEKRAKKLVPSERDKNFLPKLANNALINSISNNESFNMMLIQRGIDRLVTDDEVAQFYKDFKKIETYHAYLDGPDSDEANRNILLALYKYWIGLELYNEFIEGHFPLWYDDKSLVVGAMKKTIKAMPVEGDFFEDYRPSDEAVFEFGEQLLRYVNSKEVDLLAIIEPTLKNWDIARVAVLDVIILKLAVSEFLGFSTIPTKVTLNEYVEIAKNYSTEKSKDYINGVLDRLLKEMNKEGQIVKEGRGLLD